MDEVTTDSTVTQALLEKVRAGDAAALEQLFARHRPYLRRVIEARLDRKLSARVDASDVIQETQLDAARRIEKFLDLGSIPFKVWLRKTAHERLLDIRRRHAGAARRSVERETELADRTALEFAQLLTRSASTPSRLVSKEELVQRVRRAVAELPAVDHEGIDGSPSGTGWRGPRHMRSQPGCFRAEKNRGGLASQRASVP